MDLEPGMQFSEEIKGITRTGLATVRHDGLLINIGHVTCDSGTRVQLQYLGQSEECGNDVGYALCLTEEVLKPEYDQWVQNAIDHLIPDEAPAVGEVTYTEIAEVGDRNLGIAEFDGQRIQLGPVKAEVGLMVRIRGIGNQCAEVRTKSARGEDYQTRLNLLAGRYDEIPVSEEDEIRTTISDVDGDRLIGYIGDVPIRFPSSEAQIGQKIDGRIASFEQDMILGEVIDTYDEVGRIKHASHWARMEWLKQATTFESEPFRQFASEFIGVPESALPERDDQIRDALIAEAIRLALKDKVDDSGDEYPQAHISGLRHWAVHKLAAVLGDPSSGDDEDWFTAVMSDRTGPTLTFYGDLLQLADGYYAPAPTRAIPMAESEAVLVSAEPTRAFREAGLDIKLRGISRVVQNVSEQELSTLGIQHQSRDAYVGLDNAELLTESDLVEFIGMRDSDDWDPNTKWEPYTGQQYGFQKDGDPFTVTIGADTQVSFWRVPVEYGTDAYELKVETRGTAAAQMIEIPSQYRKEVILILSAASGVPHKMKVSGKDDAFVLTCDFAPPRPQIRWLHAIGGRWIDSPTGQLQWQIPPEAAESVVDVFEPLPVSIPETTSGNT